MFVTCDPVITSPAALVNMMVVTANRSSSQFDTCLSNMYSNNDMRVLLVVLLESGAVGTIEME